jgi:ferredoxin
MTRAGSRVSSSAADRGRAAADRGRAAGDRGSTGADSLRVNPITCEAHGICAELLPELISVDPWGYPLIAPGPVPDELLPLAKRAVAACPTLALLLGQDE